MGCDTVLLEQRFLGEMELQRIIRTQTDVESHLEEVGERVAFVSQKQGIIAERAHRQADLPEVKKIL